MTKEDTKVRVLLDMDGVINAISRSGPSSWPLWREGEAAGFRILWSPAVVDFILNLSKTPGVEIMWLSTWADNANEHISPLVGLPTFEVAGAPSLRDMRGNSMQWWKLPYAQELWEDDKLPFVWIDDDLDYDYEAKEWISTLPAASVLALCPSTETGLISEELQTIEEFISGVVNE